ncbi:putative sodium-dependent multivitamin transporter [Dermacentor albipictus]|uniref:putative sodium-dependent multivitamin transporter n=1 Tax=Dermacentor albipictus TaxID=60249 RepID=UPI0031FCA3E7
MDQMVAQRFLAARSIRSGRRVVWAGTSMLAFFILSTSLTGLALTYWYRDCDPMLTGAITRYDQLVPFYVGESLANVAGLRGLFLSGLVGASISTVSSVVNSHAATFYVDIVSPNVDLSKTQAVWVTHLLEFGSGALMTAFAVVVPHVGTATRILMSLYSGASGPFAGMVVAAICLPWTNTKGTAVATSLVFLLEIWQTIGRTLSRLEPLRMNTTLERCAHNVTTALSGLRFANESEPQVTASHFIVQRGPSAGSEADVFLLYRVSSYWSSFIALLATVLLSLVFSLIIGGHREALARNARLSSPLFLRLWSRLGLIPDSTVMPISSGHLSFKDGCAEELPAIPLLNQAPDNSSPLTSDDSLR